MKELKELVRPNIWALTPYSCARNEFTGEARIYMDANENNLVGTEECRYPDPSQAEVRSRVAKRRGLKPSQVMIGNGSDETIDLVYRVFCRPGVDNVVAIEPTYGMYRVCADVNDVEYRAVLLNEIDFSLDAEKLMAATDERTKAIWLCSPNNPTGNRLNEAEVEKVVAQFDGLVVVDEAYVDFAGESLAGWIGKYKNLIILQTFSKAWGMAGLRCGIALASEEIISLFDKVKYPYNVNYLTQKIVAEKMDDMAGFEDLLRRQIEARDYLVSELQSGRIGIVRHVYRTDANFVLVRFDNPDGVYKTLVEKGIITRNRNRVKLCAGCIRISTGTREENRELLEELKKM